MKKKLSRDTVIGRSHLTGYDDWPPPDHIREHLEIFVKFIDKNVAKGSVLDVGCGDGAIARLIAEGYPKRSVTGVDLEAHPHWRIKKPKNLKFKASSIEKLPYKDKSFDVVIIKDVLHHLPDPEAALHDIAKYAKKQVVIIEANRYNPISFVRMVKIAKHEHFSRAKLKRIVNKPAVISTVETHVWPSRLRRAGKVTDTVFNRLSILESLRNYNFVIFEP